MPSRFDRSIRIIITPLVEDLYLSLRLFESSSPRDETVIQTEQKQGFVAANITIQDGETLLQTVDDMASWVERAISTLQVVAANNEIRQKILQVSPGARSLLLGAIAKFAQCHSQKLAYLLGEKKSFKASNTIVNQGR